jgi:hypothetical protein
MGDNRWTGVIGGRHRRQWPEVVVGRVRRKRMNSEDAGVRRASVGVSGGRGSYLISHVDSLIMKYTKTLFSFRV